MTNPPHRPLLVEERYIWGTEHLLIYVVYASTTAAGNDEVLQHKLMGAEMAHITLHPNGVVNFRVKRNRNFLERFVGSDLAGFIPAPSERLKTFLARVKTRL